LANKPVEVFLLNDSSGSGGPIGLTTTNSKGQAFLSFVPSKAEIALADTQGGALSFSVVVLDPGGPPDVINFTRRMGAGE
jgi:hypothetical protein